MKIWIHAARLRTLPLSLSGIILGSFIAKFYQSFDFLLFALACLTTLLLQVLSNYANDYGDGIKGTDEIRTGEMRAVAAGKISAHAMKNAVIITALLSLLSALLLLFLAYYPAHLALLLSYIFLGLVCIWAAIQYTVGKKAYGYRGLGDIFVFLCFGLIAVIGTTMLFTKSFIPTLLLPASAIGLLSTAVLNLNNMRDLPQDKDKGKITIPVKIGVAKAKRYHSILLFSPFILMNIYFIINQVPLPAYFFNVLLPFAQKMNIRVMENVIPAELDSELKKTALLTLVFALFCGIGLVFN
ncbi:1,4-dihydroxy-2-naphthoate octaprenyltransferase [Ornithobacterium rhinotracheale]|uniref:1,4-dihydroxy-2-naphthoate octaprenyltransferase n=1 Tax=Ornithobacterium rhinotracheale TaxID=28251 RepID=A0A3R5UW79_ORNRH|nr:1,4-dihydroxy-2-naphthoate octaprenyltransferase [Ornithobacterium rhinotracheale]QAR31216.1 1,4-dihydroxy-2-naphthoate octaprenyltransferase [Ornithobacterium rhinotracheale]